MPFSTLIFLHFWSIKNYDIISFRYCLHVLTIVIFKIFLSLKMWKISLQHYRKCKLKPETVICSYGLLSRMLDLCPSVLPPFADVFRALLPADEDNHIRSPGRRQLHVPRHSRARDRRHVTWLRVHGAALQPLPYCTRLTEWPRQVINRNTKIDISYLMALLIFIYKYVILLDFKYWPL